MNAKELIVVAGPNGAGNREIPDYWYIVYNSTGELKWIASGEPDAVFVHEEPEYRQFLRLAGVSDVETGD